MSLQVWLPLNGNLNNNGLANVTVTNNGATINDNGKIGKCYQFNNTSISTTVGFKTQLTTEASIACWIKLSSSHSTWAQVMTLGTVGTSWNDIKFGIDINSSGTPIASVSTGSSYTNCPLTTTIKDDKWHHLVATYSTGHIYIYLDGNANNEIATTNVPNWNACTVFSIGGNSSEVLKHNDLMNDVRLYSHCLSEKEVKEISKGLILHYKLDNFNQNTSLITSLTAGGQTTVSENKVTTSGVNADTYFYINVTEPLILNKSYTISCIGQNFPEGTSFSFPIGSQQNTSKTFIIKQGYNEYTFTANDIIVNAGKKIILDDTDRSACTNRCEFSNFYLTENDTVKDCSGYNNDGMLNGDVKVIEDSPRYRKYAQHISTNIGTSTQTGMSNIYGNVSLTNPASLTFAFWLNPIAWGYQDSGILSTTSDSYPGDYLTSALNQYDSGFRFNATDGSYVTVSATSLISNSSWHHYALVFNGKDVLVYKDGALTTYGKSFNTNVQLGSFNKIFLGLSVAGGAWRQTSLNWSDFRVYSTALSANDIKELYQTAQSIDNNGNVYAYEFVEN